MIPSGTDKYSIRIVKIAVTPPEKSLFELGVTTVEIVDEAAGEFVVVRQEHEDPAYANSICIDPAEWPVLRDAVEFMMGECRGDA